MLVIPFVRSGGRGVNRVLGTAVAVMGILLVPLPGITQQNVRPYEERLHEDAVCGFRVTHPVAWQERWRTPEGRTDAQFFMLPPGDSEGYVVINGIWDRAAIGRYPAPGAPAERARGEEARALGTLAEVLLAGGKLPGELVWLDQHRNGPVVVSYAMQLQEDMYHLTFLLVTRGQARGLNADGWSYSVVGAWVPQRKFREVGPIVMDIVNSIEFIRADKACWT